MNEEDDEDDKGIGVSKYPCMPSLVTLLQMRNRLHLAYIGKKLMKWTAMATGRELRKISQELTEVYDSFKTDYSNAFMLLARCRYFYPNMNSIVVENIPRNASVTVGSTMRAITGVRVFHMDIRESGVEPYEHLGIEKGGHAIQAAKEAWLKILRRIILMVELRSSFEQVEFAHKCATKKMNVLAKIIIPRLMLTTHYIICELEEVEREETFRLKRVKQKKDHEKYLIAEALKDAGEVKEVKPPAPPKKEPTGQSIQPKAEPVAPKSPALAPVPVAEMGDLAVILPPGDIADPGDVFLPPRGYAALEPINEVEELIDPAISGEVLEDDNIDDAVKFGESFETGEWFEMPSDYEKTQPIQEKDEGYSLILSDSKTDERSRTTDIEESDIYETSDTKVNSEDISKTESDTNLKEEQNSENIKTESSDDINLRPEPEKFEESISSLENPTIKFRETAEALSISSIDLEKDHTQITDTLESEQVEQDLFQPELRDRTKENATTPILKLSPKIEEMVIEDTGTEEVLAPISEHSIIDDEDKNESQKETQGDVMSQIIEEHKQMDEKLTTEPVQFELMDAKNNKEKLVDHATSEKAETVTPIPEQEISDDEHKNKLQNEEVDVAFKTAEERIQIDEAKPTSEPDQYEPADDEDKHKKEAEDVKEITEVPTKVTEKKDIKSENGNDITKQMMNRPLRILSSDELLVQERQRNMQSSTEDKQEEQPEK